MNEKNAIIGILVIVALSVTAYFAVNPGQTGGAVTDNYLTCCCDILAKEGYAKQANFVLVRSQIQTRAENCYEACKYYSGQGDVFAEEGVCA